MLNMTNIVHDVWNLLDKEPSIQLDLQRNLINVRALARLVGKKLSDNGIEPTEDAVISAIRRYPKDSKFKNNVEQARKMISQSTVSIRSHIVNVAIEKSKETQEALESIFSMINFERGETLRIVQGEESIKLLVDEKNLSNVLKIIKKSAIIGIQKNLAEVNLHLHPEAVRTPGILLAITTDLLLNNVNMYEIMSCVPEMLIFVEEKDLLKTHQVIFELCQAKK